MAFLQGSEGEKQRRIRAWMLFKAKQVVGYPRPELGGKNAGCTTILSKRVVDNVLRKRPGFPLVMGLIQ
jgi:hypothetical protein